MKIGIVMTALTVGLNLFACTSSSIEADQTSFTGAALRTSGILDTSYGTLGVVSPLGNYSPRLSIQNDGKALVLTGSGRTSSHISSTLSRLLSNGQPDLSFGLNGEVTVPGHVGAVTLVCPNGVNAYNDWGATCQAPERLEISATVVQPVLPAVLSVYRFLPSGQADPSFGLNGVATTPSAWGFTYATATDLSIQADGKTLMIGDFVTQTSSGSYLARLKRNGTPDPDFGNGGLVLLPSTAGTVQALALPNSEYPVVLTRNSSSTAQVLRFTDSGKPDLHFGIGGMVQLDFAVTDGATSYALLALDNNRLVVGGPGYLWQLLPNGNPDTNFGIAGHSIVANFDIRDLVLDDQNRLLAAANIFPFVAKEATLMRFKPSGVLDSSFGTGGMSNLNFCSVFCDVTDYYYVFSSLALQRNGRVLGASTQYSSRSSQVQVVRVLP